MLFLLVRFMSKRTGVVLTFPECRAPKNAGNGGGYESARLYLA